MKHLKLFFALFAMLALGVGNAWGAEVTETIKMKGFAGLTSSGYQNVTKTGTSDAGTTMVAYAFNPGTGQVRGNKTTVAGASVTNEDKNKNWSLYNSQAMAGAIKAIKVTQTATGSSNKFQNNLYVSLGTSSQGSITAITNAQKQDAGGTAQEINFTIDASKGYTYFKLLSTEKFVTGTIAGVVVTVTYETSSGGDEPVASLTATPTTIDFGTVYQGADVESKTVAVNFENLTGNVTYSGLSTPFTATGTVSNDGDKITIAADASTIGEYSQTLTITSAADSKTAEVTVKMNVVEKPAPTGTFTLHTGALVEGDYVIYYNGKAMKAAVSSNRLGYEEVTPSGNEIVDPLAATIWHIAPSGDNWTIYNDNKGYAAGTGTKSQAQLVANLTGDNANKAAWTVTGTSTYEFTNVWNASISVNAALRNNGTYGFACYATSTGGALSLYRKAGAKYNVTVNSTTNGTVTADPTSAEAGTTITLTVTPAGGYVLDALTVTDASSNPVTVTDNKFTMPASDVTVTATFKENEKPAATLTLSKNGVEETFPGSWKQDDVVTLPSITSDCVKEFVGWSANPTCNEAPEYAAGDSYTLAATAQTLYAVYATAGAGETLTITPSAVSGSADPYTFTIDAAGYSLTAKKNGGSTAPTYTSNEVRVYAKGTVTLTAPKAMGTIVFNISTNGKKRLAPITASVGTIATQASGDATVTWTGDATEVTFTVGDIAEFGSENTKAGQLCFGTMTVTTAGSYSNYSTTCSAALANPTFSLAEGKYTEAKSVEITATEGTVYYTTDGTTPTASSTQYTGAIALNDCGEYTIKAIAISADSQSDVVSATYTIKLPLTNSQAAPYTEAEAIAVYDGGCYDNQDVYVKGTVKSATFNSAYGNYTITLTDGFQFYRFLQAAETKFTEDIIVPGDVLVACGKLSKYNTTYQLAEGCYLVERIPYEGEKTDISNTEATAYTVDQAFALIADVTSDLTKEVYVKGLVAVAPTSNPTDAGKMTYSISDDGEKTGKVLKVYLGLGIDGAKFTSKDDVKQGDYVVAKGKLLDYSGTYELTDNQLVQHVKAASITIANITMEVGETKTIAATITPAAAETAVVYTIKENTDNAISLSGNTITANAVGTATITATIATAAEYMGKTVEFKVTVTPVNIATLPFYFDGGVDDIATTLGMSQDGLGADYTTEGTTTKLKFDGTGDWVIIHFNGQADKLAYDIKGNGFSGGTFSVQQSADGNTYEDVVSYTELGDAEEKEHSLAAESRYVKFIYTNKSSGNVGLGNIAISGALPTYTLTLVSNPDEIGATLTGSGTYKGTQDVTVTASHTDADWVFAYWTLDEKVVSYASEYTFSLGADTELVANFATGGTVSDMTNLVIDTETYADTYMAVLTGSDMMMNLDVMLAVSENIEGDLYKLGAAEVTFQGESLDFVSGTVTIDMEAYTATANIIVSFGGQLMAITCNMSATAAAPVDVMVADATVTYSDNDGTLRFNGTDAYSSDAVYVELSGFEYNGVGENTLSVAQISMFENSTAFAFADEVVVTIESDGTVSVEGTYTSWADGSVYNVSIWGALPTYTLTLVSNPDESGATLTGAGTYYPTQEVTVTASNEDTEWVFAYWTVEEEVVSSDSEYTFRLGADMELVANYAMGGTVSDMTNLVIDTETYADTYMAVLTGSDMMMNLDVMLAVSENIEGDLYKLGAAEVTFQGESLDFVSGTVTIDMEAYTATANIIVSFGGQLMAITCNMSATAAAPVDVMVADATVTYSDNDGTLRFNGTDAYSSDAVYVELSGFEYNGVGENTLSVAQISMFENSTAFAFADEVVVTIESDGTVFVEGTYTSWADGSVYNVSIWGALPTYTLTLVSNPDEIGTVLTGAGTYYAAEEVTISASNEDTEWVFAYWTLDEEVVSYDAEYTFRLGADMELVANFEQTTPAPTPDYTRSVTAGNYGTICLEFGATKIEGAELYEVVSKENGGVWLASVTELVAGTPYIFRATATELAVYSDGTTATEAGSANGLIGNFTNEFVVPTGNYILYKNTFIPADGATNKLNANRAYLDLDAVQEGTPVQMPGRRYIGMSVQGENGTTGLDNIVAPEGQLIKTIENGQLIIIRNGEKFNAMGVKL